MNSLRAQTDDPWRHQPRPNLLSRPALRRLARAFLPWAALILTSPAALRVARASVLYVDSASTSPSRPYTTWATAAQAIQDAVAQVV